MPAQVLLRPILPADVPALYQFQLDPESNALAAVNPRDLATFNALFAKILAEPPEARQTTARAIIATATGANAQPTLVGSISCFKHDGLDSVGYWIARQHWGKGYASRAVALLIKEVTTRPLHARVASHNAASLRVLERNGFVITGRRHSPGTERYHACEEVSLTLA